MNVLQQYFQTLARYNRWANARLTEGVSAVAETAEGEALLRRPLDLPMGSLWITLNHLLVADRLWLHRITGIGPTYPSLDQEIAPTLDDYRRERAAEDDRIVDLIPALDGIDERVISYSRVDGTPLTTPLRFIMAHLFNHATHHRSQVFSALRQAGTVVQPLDLIYYLRDHEPTDHQKSLL